MREKKIIVWFRNDLRLHDQEALYRAAAKTTYVIPVYCFDPRQFEKLPLGFPKTGAIRAKFLIESVEALRKSLQRMGSDLIIRIGKPEEVIPNLVQLTQASAVYTSKEIAPEEVPIENELEAKLWSKRIPFEQFWLSTLFHIEDIPFPIKSIPDSFIDFRKEAEDATTIRSTLPVPQQLTLHLDFQPGKIPTLQELGFREMPIQDPRAVMEFRGGEEEGLKRLQTYFWEENRLADYKDTRNGLIGAGYSTKLSCWLALGCLSPRKVYEEIKRYEKERVKNESTECLTTELLWRDYFRFITKKYGSRIFRPEGMRGSIGIQYSDNLHLFGKWLNGETGLPFIDAHMQELKSTGFLSNRGRQSVGSFLTHTLRVNWTYGAMYFESQQLDYDVCLNWCNWNYLAGVGNDPRENRQVNPLAQAKRYDPQGEYIKLWLPKLAAVPSSRIHYVADLSLTEQKQYGVILGVNYPSPIVRYDQWAA